MLDRESALRAWLGDAAAEAVLARERQRRAQRLATLVQVPRRGGTAIAKRISELTWTDLLALDTRPQERAPKRWRGLDEG